MSPLNFDALRARLAKAQGPAYWRSLSELARAPEFEELLAREFPREAEVWRRAPDRREVLKILAASLALAGLGGCSRRPPEKILPYVRAPEGQVPGRPLTFASVLCDRGYGLGILAKSHEGRPVKIEGNPVHPASLGATDARAQAALLTLYDPDRSQGLLRRGQISSWTSLLAELKTLPRGIRVLSGPLTSPTLARQLRELLDRHPDARWDVWAPAGDAESRGARLAFGRDVSVRYDLKAADLVLSLDGDFLCRGPGGVRYARDWAARREPGAMSRLYAIESSPTLTGARADHRRAVKPSDVGLLAGALAAAIRDDRPLDDPWLEGLRRDLLRHRGTSLVVAGGPQPPEVHAQALALNALLGNWGRTVHANEPVEARPSEGVAGLRALTEDLRAGRVGLLLVLGSNPVYTAPPGLGFAEALAKAPLSIRVGLYADETSKLCRWHVPEAHALESWSDARAFDGTASLQQPLIEPLYGGRSAHEVLAALLGRAGATSYDLVRETWRDIRWEEALHEGVVPGTEARRLDLVPKLQAPAPPRTSGFELILAPDPYLDDGELAENAWLQELPRPLTTLTWDNALIVGPATAQALKVSNEEVVELRVDGRSRRAPVWILPGHPAGSATLHLGYGRSAGGRVALGVGVNAYLLRDAEARGFVGGVELKKTGERYRLAPTQDHWALEGRNLIRSATLEEFRKDPELFHDEPHEVPNLYKTPDRDPDVAWGMSIDLGLCTGCSACVVACQSENNVPTVGKTQVLNSREMHWLRIDRYFAGPPDAPEVHVQPMLCQHCETAPCEVVCPTNATVHSRDGLNQMVYNRCVGTRYCSNNCPYKVRRFNFLQYVDWGDPARALGRNPDVSVRERGVMEKCTFCVQRVQRARIDAGVAGRPMPEIQTACAQACPTGAIVFGNLRNPAAEVARKASDPRGYGALAELGTRPRVTYMGRLRNPNPEMPG